MASAMCKPQMAYGRLVNPRGSGKLPCGSVWKREDVGHLQEVFVGELARYSYKIYHQTVVPWMEGSSSWLNTVPCAIGRQNNKLSSSFLFHLISSHQIPHADRALILSHIYLTGDSFCSSFQSSNNAKENKLLFSQPATATSLRDLPSHGVKVRSHYRQVQHLPHPHVELPARRVQPVPQQIQHYQQLPILPVGTM